MPQTAQILDGKKSQEFYTKKLIQKIQDLSFVPTLVVIQVGNRKDSTTYIKVKKAFAELIGAQVIHIHLDENVTQEEVIRNVKNYNTDDSVQGIIVQLPLPQHLTAKEIVDSVTKEKDVDGLVPYTKFLAATARGIKELLEFYKINLSGKKVTMLGRSNIVGKPTALMCAQEGAIVTVCHSATEHIEEKTKSADIVIVAIGKPKLINQNYLSKGQVVIDVGITRHIDNNSLVGDVDFEAVKDIVAKITPVPGGVGQMTVLALFENLVDAC